MSLSIRQVPDAVIWALVLTWNQYRGNASQVGASFHADATPAGLLGDNLYLSVAAATTPLQATATAVDLPTSITLAANLGALFRMHWTDAISTHPYGAGAHKIPDAANLTALALLAPPTDLPSTIVYANALKAEWNAHLSSAGVHFNNDGANAVVAANATDLPSLLILLSAIKAAFNAHVVSAPAGSNMIKTVAA